MKWIPVNEKLPNVYDTVLICKSNDSTSHVGHLGHNNHWYIDSVGTILDPDRWNNKSFIPTHWSEFPTPPVETKTQSARQ